MNLIDIDICFTATASNRLLFSISFHFITFYVVLFHNEGALYRVIILFFLFAKCCTVFHLVHNFPRTVLCSVRAE